LEGFIDKIGEVLLVGFKSEDGMNTAVSSRVGRDILKEVNFGLVSN
jgi:hypothetical protein